MSTETAKVKALEERVRELEAEVASLRDELKDGRTCDFVSQRAAGQEQHQYESPDLGSWRPWFAQNSPPRLDCSGAFGAVGDPISKPKSQPMPEAMPFETWKTHNGL